VNNNTVLNVFLTEDEWMALVAGNEVVVVNETPVEAEFRLASEYSKLTEDNKTLLELGRDSSGRFVKAGSRL